MSFKDISELTGTSIGVRFKGKLPPCQNQNGRKFNWTIKPSLIEDIYTLKMEKENLHTFSPDRLNDLKARLHAIPKQYIVERNKTESKSKKAVLRPFLRLSIAAAASIIFVIFLWPKEQNNKEEFTEDGFQKCMHLIHSYGRPIYLY